MKGEMKKEIAQLARFDLLVIALVYLRLRD